MEASEGLRDQSTEGREAVEPLSGLSYSMTESRKCVAGGLVASMVRMSGRACKDVSVFSNEMC